MRTRTQASAASAADALLGVTKKQAELPTEVVHREVATPAQFAELPHPGGHVAPMATSPIGEQDFGVLQRGLVQGGCSVSLVTIAQWSPAYREAARRWVVDGRGWEPMKRPAFLDEYAAKHPPLPASAAVPGVVPSDQGATHASVGHAMVNALHAQARAPSSVEKVLAEIPGPAILPDAQAYRTGAVRAEIRGLPVTHVAVEGKATVTVGKAAADALPPPSSHPPLYATANRGPGITPDFARIVESVYASDAFKDYDDLEKNLEVGEQRGDYLSLREHLDKAEQRARRAHRLYLGAKLERANWERDAEVTSAAMRNAAHEELEEEKATGDRKKMITDADVTSRVAEKFPDEWRAQETTRHKLKGVESSIEHLVKCWDQKVFGLRTLLETLRK
jgi:hypothetical protein